MDSQISYSTDDLDFALQLCEDREIRREACTNVYVEKTERKHSHTDYVVIFEGARTLQEVNLHIARIRGPLADPALNPETDR